MRNKAFLIWVIFVFTIEMIDTYLSFVTGYGEWKRSFYSKDVIGLSSLIDLLIYFYVAKLLYEPKED